MEIRNFGWNAATIGYVGTFFFATLAWFAHRKQCRIIWREKSGESIATVFYIFNSCLMAIALMYGLMTDRLALVGSGLLSLSMSIPILVGLWKFKGYRNSEWLSLAVCLLWIGVFIVTSSTALRSAVYGGFVLASVPLILTQAYEFVRTRRVGVYRAEPLVISMVSTAFWVMYSTATQDTVLMTVCPWILVALFINMGLWVHYGGDVRTLFRK